MVSRSEAWLLQSCCDASFFGQTGAEASPGQQRHICLSGPRQVDVLDENVSKFHLRGKAWMLQQLSE